MSNKKAGQRAQGAAETNGKEVANQATQLDEKTLKSYREMYDKMSFGKLGGKFNLADIQESKHKGYFNHLLLKLTKTEMTPSQKKSISSKVSTSTGTYSFEDLLWMIRVTENIEANQDEIDEMFKNRLLSGTTSQRGVSHLSGGIFDKFKK